MNPEKPEINTRRRNFIKLSFFSIGAFILGKVSAPFLSKGDGNTAAVGDANSPTTPTGVVGTPLSSSQVNLSWNASTDADGVSGYRVYRSQVIPNSTPAPAPTPPSPSPNPNPTSGLRANAGKGSAWLYVDKIINVLWDKPGGDWLDQDGVRHGSKAFATGKISALGISELGIDVSNVLPKLFIENTGLHLHMIAGPGGIVRFATPQNTTHPAPRFVVTQADGRVINCPLYWAGPLSSSVPEVITMQGQYWDTSFHNMILKADLSNVTEPTGATAKLYLTSFWQYYTLAYTPTIGVFLLDPPKMIDDPALLGPEEQGVATDSDVFFRSKFTSVEQGLADGYMPRAQIFNWADKRYFEMLPGGKLRIRLLKGNQYGSSFRRRLSAKHPSAYYANSSDEPSPTEAYIAFALTIPEDAGDIDGVKLPGANGGWQEVPDLDNAGFSLRTEHGVNSSDNPNHLWHFTYSYVPGQVGSGSGSNWSSAQDKRYVIRKGTTLFKQQHVKLNTFDANGKANADGVYELWLNWRRVFHWTGVLRTDPRIGIRELIQVQIFHGGRQLATHDVDYIMWPVMAARKFIGRPLYESFLGSSTSIPNPAPTPSPTTPSPSPASTPTPTPNPTPPPSPTPTPTPSPSPSSPLPTPVSGVVTFTPNLAVMDKTGAGGVPLYQSVHLTKAGKIISIGWAGLHSATLSVSVQEFDPITETSKIIAPWRQWVSPTNLTELIPPVPTGSKAGYNWYTGNYDNHMTAYLPGTNSIVWVGHGVFDLNINNWIRGSQPPATQDWKSYFTNGTQFAGLVNSYNPCYAECHARNESNFFGTSIPSGGSIGEYQLLSIKQTDTSPNAVAPWTFSLHSYSATQVRALKRARNNAACIGSKMYFGGAQYGPPATQSDGLFTLANHDYQPNQEVAFGGDLGQIALPTGLTYGQRYYVRDITQNTFRIAATPNGPAVSMGSTPINSSTKLPHSLGPNSNYRLWVIDLDTKAISQVSNEWALGQYDAWPQLIADSKRNRLYVLGKSVTEFDIGSRTWRRLDVPGWPAGGYHDVHGRYSADRDKIYFRGTPYNWVNSGNDLRPWQWNAISFS